MAEEPISPYIFTRYLLHDSTYRPKVTDVRKLHDAYDYMRDSRLIIMQQRCELERKVDQLELEIWRLKHSDSVEQGAIFGKARIFDDADESEDA